MENEGLIGDRTQPDVVRWQLAGHQVIYERNTFRHKDFRKDFPKGTIVKFNGVPFITSAGKILTTDDVLPERGDLALDMDANILPQHEFARRYRDFLEWFTWIENTDLNVEPIPSVTRFISATPDVFSESRGYIPIGFDARKPPEKVATHQYDPRSDEFVEIAKNQAVMSEAMIHLLEEIKNRPKRGRPRKVTEDSTDEFDGDFDTAA